MLLHLTKAFVYYNQSKQEFLLEIQNFFAFATEHMLSSEYDDNWFLSILPLYFDNGNKSDLYFLDALSILIGELLEVFDNPLEILYYHPMDINAVGVITFERSFL